MPSEKQLAANRLNAQKSTGPRSPEGKSKTRLNAKRDGITGQITTLSDHDRPIFEKFKKDLITDLAPKTTLELNLANAIAWDTWRLNHLRAVEMNMYALGTDDPANAIDCGDDPELHTAMTGALTFTSQAQKFALMSLYEQRMNRSLHKNLATLRELQAERKKNYKRDRDQEITLARYSDIAGQPYQAPAAPTLNGSVFSNEEVLAAANRLSSLELAKYEVRHSPLKVQFAGASSSGTQNTQSKPVIEWPNTELPKKDAA